MRVAVKSSTDNQCVLKGITAQYPECLVAQLTKTKGKRDRLGMVSGAFDDLIPTLSENSFFLWVPEVILKL